MPPLFSVVIVCRNPGTQLADAVSSVQRQTGALHELVVIDGASTDGSADWLRTRRDTIATLLSEPDGGVYEAMNKGIAAARGDWIIFLGADDRFASDTVLHTAASIIRSENRVVFVGEARFSDGRLYRLENPRHAVRRNFVHHQAAFYPRRVFAEHGGFDVSLRLQSDYDFNLRLLRNGTRFAPIPLRIAECRAGGLSDSGRWDNYREEILVRHRHFSLLHSAIWDAGSIVRCGRKKIVQRMKSHG